MSTPNPNFPSPSPTPSESNPYASPETVSEAPGASTKHPVGFWFIFWGEFAERSSYYGMRAILANYMKNVMRLGEDNAASYMSYFIAGCYFLPLLGGYLADKFFGKYWTIVGFSVPYIIGHFVLGIENFTAMVIALALLAMGSGVIKPNISSLMGMTYDQQRPGQDRLRSNAFAIFYLAINIGSAISSYFMPTIRDQYGYAVAFMFPTILMVAALAIFAAGKRYYAVEKIEKRVATPEELAEKWRVLRRLLGLFTLVAFFWAIFDQSTSTWIFFGDVYMDGKVFGVKTSAEQMQAMNPVLVVLLLPGVTLLWNLLDRKGIRIRATDKMVLGFVLTATTMGVMAYAGHLAGPTGMRVKMKDDKPVLDKKTGEPVIERIPLGEDRQVSLGWQAVAYLVLTIAEILISVTGLELAFVAAPKSMKSFVVALWQLTVGIANLFINAPVTRLYATMEPPEYFGMLAAALVVVTVAFVFVARRFNASDGQVVAAA